MKRLLVFLVVLTTLLACSTAQHRQQSSNLVAYLYPNEQQLPAPQHPVLPLPLKVGIAFLPAEHQGIDELQQTLILQQIKQGFEREKAISRVVIIPSTYLRDRRGFDHLTQLAKMYGVDVLTLVSYEQIAQASDRKSSFLYWTLIGAYGVKGTRNDVQTYLDAAVFDVASRSLLFRADGIDARTANSNMVEAELTQRQMFEQSLQTAANNLTENLQVALQLFKDDVKQEQVATIKPRIPAISHHGGGGSFSSGLLLIVLFIWLGKRVLSLCERLPNEPR